MTIKKTAFIIASLLILILLIYHIFQYVFLTDDAFISFRYARNIADGYGPVFNIGEHVEGYTNFLWVILLAMFSLLGIHPESMAPILSIACSLFLFGAVFYFNREVFSRKPYDYFILIAPLFLALNRTCAVWSTGGLETKLFSLLIFLGIICTVRTGDKFRGGYKPAAMFFALASLTRPEGILLFGSFFGYQLIVNYKNPEQIKKILKSSLIFIIIIGSHFIFRYIYYGYPFPNTFYAKVTGAWLISGLLYIWLFVHEYGLYLLLPACLFLLSKKYDREKFETILDLRIPFILYIIYLIYIGGDHFEFRPLDVILPVLAISIQEGIRAVWIVIKSSELKPLKYAAPIYIIIALILYTSTSRLSHDNFPDKYASAIGIQTSKSDNILLKMVPGLKAYLGVSDKIHASLVKNFVCIRQEEHKMALEQIFLPQARLFERFIDQGYIKKTEIISLWCVGAIPYYSGLTTIDYLGLTDEHIAHRKLHDTPDKLLPFNKLMAHQKRADRKYLKERKVAFISVRPAIFFFPKDEFLVNGQVPKDKRVPGSFIVPMDEYIFWFTSTFVPLDVAYVFYNRGLEISFIDSKGEEHLFLNQENKRPIPTGSAEIQNNN